MIEEILLGLVLVVQSASLALLTRRAILDRGAIQRRRVSDNRIPFGL